MKQMLFVVPTISKAALTFHVCVCIFCTCNAAYPTQDLLDYAKKASEQPSTSACSQCLAQCNSEITYCWCVTPNWLCSVASWLSNLVMSACCCTTCCCSASLDWLPWCTSAQPNFYSAGCIKLISCIRYAAHQGTNSHKVQLTETSHAKALISGMCASEQQSRLDSCKGEGQFTQCSHTFTVQGDHSSPVGLQNMSCYITFVQHKDL